MSNGDCGYSNWRFFGFVRVTAKNGFRCKEKTGVDLSGQKTTLTLFSPVTASPS
jgi:hypothetical protein